MAVGLYFQPTLPGGEGGRGRRGEEGGRKERREGGREGGREGRGSGCLEERAGQSAHLKVGAWLGQDGLGR